MDIDPIFPMCGEMEKIIFHALFFYSLVARIWFSSHLSSQFPSAYEFVLQAWLLELLDMKDDWLVDQVMCWGGKFGRGETNGCLNNA